MLTEQTLQRMMPAAGARLDDHLPYIVPETVERRADIARGEAERAAALRAQKERDRDPARSIDAGLADPHARTGAVVLILRRGSIFSSPSISTFALMRMHPRLSSDGRALKVDISERSRPDRPGPSICDHEHLHVVPLAASSDDIAKRLRDLLFVVHGYLKAIELIGAHEGL